MVNITDYASWSIEQRKKDCFKTAFLNLTEESGLGALDLDFELTDKDIDCLKRLSKLLAEGKHQEYKDLLLVLLDRNGITYQEFTQTHRELGELAFNTVGYTVFGLDNVTLKKEYDNPRWDEELKQREVFLQGYRINPILASWLQENASGGSEEERGMMGDLFRLPEALQPRIPPEKFETKVLPYYKAHIGIKQNPDGSFKYVFSPSAIEYLHGSRAEKDLLQNTERARDVRETLAPFAVNFYNVQSNLFSRIETEVNRV